MFLYDDDGLRYEVDAEDVEEDASGEGVWLLTAEGEDEDFYAYCADSGDE